MGSTEREKQCEEKLTFSSFFFFRCHRTCFGLFLCLWGGEKERERQQEKEGRWVWGRQAGEGGGGGGGEGEAARKEVSLSL